MTDEIQPIASQNFGFNSIGNSVANADKLESIGSSYALSSILLSAVELNVFDCLVDGSKTCDRIAAEIDVDPDALKRLTIALTAIDLLQCNSMGEYQNTSVSTTFLTKNSPQSMTSSLLFHKRCYDLFGNLTAVIKSGKQQFAKSAPVDDYYSELAKQPEEYFIFLEAMNRSSVGIGAALATSVDFSKIDRVIDLGAGGGQISIELAQAVPHLTLTMVDLPIACEFLQRRICDLSLEHRLECVQGSILNDLSEQLELADAVILSGILADWGATEGVQILHHARNLLKPGGLLLVSETLFDETKTALMQPAILSLCMLLAMQGDNFTPSEIASILERSGFVDVRFCFKHETGVRDLIIAQKPL
jgi:precorrin-6B methylase 2